MKNIFKFILLSLFFIGLFVLYSLDQQYGWIDISINWPKWAIGGAAAGGPIQYIMNKMNERRDQREEFEQQMNFRTLTNDEFKARENYNKGVIVPENQNETKITSEVDKDNFEITEPTFG